MSRHSWVVVVALAIGTALPALAEEPCAAPAPCFEQTSAQPVADCERRVPVYETVMVPTVERVRVPVYRDVQTPVYETREVPVYRTVTEPVWQECEVPVYREVCKPVKVELWNPFGCDDFQVRLWDTTECVPCGTERKMMVVGHQERQVVCGTRLERVQVGTETRRVLTGYRSECVTTGQRPEQRLTGWTTERVAAPPPAPCQAN